MGREEGAALLICLPAGRGPTALCRALRHCLLLPVLLCKNPPPPSLSLSLCFLSVLIRWASSTFPGMKERASHSLARCSKLGISVLEKEVADLYLPFCEEDNQHKTRDVSEPSKPFAAFGSFQQRHGEMLERNDMRSAEAPAKLESATCVPKEGLSQELSLHHNDGNGRLDMVSIDCGRLPLPQAFKLPPPPCKLHKSFSTDLDREEAWERKKELYLLEEEGNDSDDSGEYDADEELYDGTRERGIADESSSGSDVGNMYDNEKDAAKQVFKHGEGNSDDIHLDVAHGDEEHLNALQEDGIGKTSKRMPFYRKKSFTRRPFKPFIRTRTKSLTDQDMEELRGSIDLGFGFSFSEHSSLRSTLPALGLYYAINKNYVDAQSRSSPVSPLDGNVLIRTNSAGSTLSPSSDTWRIASPGDHPSQVKTRLRHWAQAVACSVKQAY